MNEPLRLKETKTDLFVRPPFLDGFMMNEPLRLKETKTDISSRILSSNSGDEWTSPIKGDENS